MKNVAILATGTAGAQAINMAFAPIITRLYGPEAFGLLGTFIAILSVLTPIAALTYPIAIVLPKSDNDAAILARLSIRLSIFVALLFSVIIYSTDEYLFELLSLGVIKGLYILLPVAMLFSALQQVFTQWLIRNKQFSVTARAAIAQSIILNISKVGAGLFLPAGIVLIILATMGQLFHSILLWLGLSSDRSRIFKNQDNIHTEKHLAKKYSDFAIYRSPQVAINAASQSLPILLLASFFGPAAAGFYALGRTVLDVPATLIGKSVGDVFYPRITEAAHNNEDLFSLLVKATFLMAAIAIIPFAIVITFGPWLFSIVFGEQWITAGSYAQWMGIWLYFGFLNRPAIAAIATLNLQRFFLLYEILSVIARAAALYIGFYIFKSDIIAVASFSIAGAILNSILIAKVLSKVRRRKKDE